MRRAVLLSSCILAIVSQPVLAGARIDIRPAPPMPPEGYAPGLLIRLDVYVVDTGNPQGNILFRAVLLDFVQTPRNPPFPLGPSGDLIFPGEDGVAGAGDDDDRFFWEETFGLPQPPDELPNVSWVYPLPTPSPVFQFVMPDNGEVKVGYTYVRVGDLGGTIDLMNSSAEDPNLGARIDFGFDTENDPYTVWRAHTGELTGGRLDLRINHDMARRIIASEPASDSIDARQPTDLLGGGRSGWTSLVLEFDGDVPTLAPSDLFVSETGGDGVAPGVANVVPLSPGRVRVELNEPLEPGTWTSFLHTASGTSVRLGYLPGDVNGDHVSCACDIIELIDSLNGVAPRPMWATDINRSGAAEPSDILRLIDLLNGADAFDPWLGEELP